MSEVIRYDFDPDSETSTPDRLFKFIHDTENKRDLIAIWEDKEYEK